MNRSTSGRAPVNRKETSMEMKFAPAVLAGCLVGLATMAAEADEEQGWWFGGSLAATDGRLVLTLSVEF